METGNKTITIGKQQSGFVASKPDVKPRKGTGALMTLHKRPWSTTDVAPWAFLVRFCAPRGISWCSVSACINLQCLYIL